MGFGLSDILYYLVHPHEIRAIVQWKTWHDPVHKRDPGSEPETLQRCFYYLDKTSRSFSSVIQELHPELLVPIAVFYLILRGLDTIEDDMTIPLTKKDPLLRNFYTELEKEGWSFDGSGPNEKDRDLLVEFHAVVQEFRQTKPAYRKIIADITQKMGDGMADYVNIAEHNANGVNTVKDYDLYCHYVAGLVGEGVTRLFVEAGLGNPLLLERPYLHESMGLFLQKTNIIRDVHEDFEGKRRFWPKEIWSKHVDSFDDLFNPENREKALNCSSEMVLNALEHVDDCLFYLAGLKEQSVFNFAAIPQTMAIASLELCFQNHSMFQRNVKITKGQACRIMIDSTQNLKKVCEVFRTHTRKIMRKNKSKDPNFLKISIACSKIEKYIDGLFPAKDAKVSADPAANQQSEADKESEREARRDMMLMLVAVMTTLFVISTIMIGIAWWFGARFDLATDELKRGKLSKADPSDVANLIDKYDRGEL